MIAMAMAMRPRLLIADEPTTALDATIRAQILELLRDLSATTGTAVLLITHDFGVVNEVADRVAVMYAGQIVEEGTRVELLSRPRHPYTQGLLRSIPRPEARGTQARGDQGRGAAAWALAARAAASTRAAPFAFDRCRGEEPRAHGRFAARKLPGATSSSRRCSHERAQRRCAAGGARLAHLVPDSHAACCSA